MLDTTPMTTAITHLIRTGTTEQALLAAVAHLFPELTISELSQALPHMSKAEWRTACARVSREREQFYLNTPGALSAGERALR